MPCSPDVLNPSLTLDFLYFSAGRCYKRPSNYIYCMATTNNRRSNRGFAVMDEDKQREIASKGGKAAHEKGTAHEFDSREGREAGSKGGKASHGSNSDEMKDQEDLDTRMYNAR